MSHTSTAKPRIISALSIFANAVTAGSIFTYPVFASALQTHLGFSVQQVSTTASIAILCQYIASAFWGALADRSGPGRVSLWAGILFGSGYWALSSIISGAQKKTEGAYSTDWISATFAYSLCGIATYFAALTASAQIFGSSNPGLSIAGPSTLFGLSPLLLTFLGTQLFSHQNVEFDTIGYLRMLSIITLVVNLIGAYALRIEYQHKEDVNSDQEDDERRALLSSINSNPTAASESCVLNQVNWDLRAFLSKPTVWILGMIVLLSAGPTEMTIASIGSVVDVYSPGGSIREKATQVQLISIANTISRLSTGGSSDKLCGQSWGGRLVFLASAPLIFSIISLAFGLGFHSTWVLSLLTGICYGTVFTIAPSLVATVWPISSFGRNYGIISYFAALGSFIFTLIFGLMYDENHALRSIQIVYLISFFNQFLSIGLCFLLYKIYWSKGVA